MPDFSSDYTRSAHPALLEAIAETAGRQYLPYGTDAPSACARARIREACRAPDADVFFLLGGTQTNRLAADVLLRPYEGVLAADTGHVALHEAGAIEHGGHKVLTVPHRDGKLTADAAAAFCAAFYGDGNREHMVFPGMIYVSQPTEYGTLYSLAELRALREVCDRFSLRLYADGARLAYALASPQNDVTLPDLAALCDAFYIGGTKCGAFCGEALVVPNPANTPRLFTQIKQHGFLLAKGFLTGVQFERLFRDDLYLTIGKSAVALADRIREGLKAKGCVQPMIAPTNQVFVLLENEWLQALQKTLRVSFWEAADDSHTVVRLATDWATTEADVDALLALF